MASLEIINSEQEITQASYVRNSQLASADLHLKNAEYTEAIKLYMNLQMNGMNSVNLWNNLGAAWLKLKEFDLAKYYFERAYVIEPKNIDIMANLGNVYCYAKDFETSETILLRAKSIAPNHYSILYNLGYLYHCKGDVQKSQHYYLLALRQNARAPELLFNLGNSFRQTGQYDTSCFYLHRCLTLQPDHADAALNLGLNQLAMGEFYQGWRHYFQRVRFLENPVPLSPIEPGKTYKNKHICFLRAQGVGDELFFLRFIPVLKQQGVNISYQASAKVFAFLQNIDLIDNLLCERDPLPEADYYYAIDDIALILNMTHVKEIPKSLSLTVARQAMLKVKNYLNKKYRPLIGVTWRAGTPKEKQSGDSVIQYLSKQISLEQVVNILQDVNADLVILQRGCERAEIQYLKQRLPHRIIDASSINDSLEDCLAVQACLDDYIGVSNTNMHLRLALGKTGSVLVPFPADWRWLVQGDESPWFPGFEVYRQTVSGDWQEEVNRLNHNLRLRYQ